MWERQYEKGRWNGLELNILSTSIDGGKRLHVSEIPYADLPHIKVMGSAASKVDLEVVFVGQNSLIETNNLLDNLDKTPNGELEHPWLGELSLVFDTYSQKLTTKRGLVTLSLKFIRAGKQPQLASSVLLKTNTSQQTKAVETISIKTFERDIASLDIASINTLQQNFTQVIGKLVGISNRLNVSSQLLSSLNRELNSAFAAISSIANSPGQFAEQLSKTIDSVANAIHAEDKSENEAIDNSRTAQAAMLALVNTKSPSAHFNVQLVTATVKMSKDISTLEQAETFNIVNAYAQPEIIMSDLQQITTQLNARIDEVTSVSTQESLELFHALVTLKEGVDTQHNKVKKSSEAQRNVEQARFIPALVLAHQTYSDPTLLTALNGTKHPLFLQGNISVRGS